MLDLLEEAIVAFVVVTILIVINGLYVAAEFAAVSARTTRLESEGDNEDSRVAWLVRLISCPKSLDAYVATAQVGITVSSLSLGLFGQTYIAPGSAVMVAAAGLSEDFVLPFSLGLTLLLLTGLQVILGELVPKSLGISSPERVALLTSGFMKLSLRLFAPLIWFFNGSSNLILRAFGADGDKHSERNAVRTAEDIRLMAQESRTGGVLDDVSFQLLDNALRLRGLTAAQVKIPRGQVLAFEEQTPLLDALRDLAESPHSRAPVYRKDLDHILGLVHIKDLFEVALSSSDAALANHLRPLPIVPETISARRLFWQLQNERFHMAAVIDEYGGTSGILTLEDLIERIVGSINDEFDLPETPSIILHEDRLQILGSLPLVDFNDTLGLALVAEESFTLAGLLIETHKGFPNEGEVVKVGGLSFTIEATDGRTIERASLPLTSELREAYYSFSEVGS